MYVAKGCAPQAFGPCGNPSTTGGSYVKILSYMYSRCTKDLKNLGDLEVARIYFALPAS